MMERTRRIVRQARRRMLAADIVSRCGRWVLWGAGAGVLAILAAKVVDVPWSWPWLIGVPNVLALCGAAVFELVRPRPLLTAANEVDERLGLKSRLSTALSFAERAGADPFHDLAEAEAEAASGRANLARSVPIRFGRAWVIWPGLALASVAIAIWVPHVDLLGRNARLAGERERPSRTEALAREVSEAVKVAQVATPPERVRGASEEQLKALTEIQQELAAGKIDPKRAAEQAASTLNALADAREKEAEQGAMKQRAVRETLAEMPAQTDKPAPLSEAVREGDFARAAKDARSLAQAAQEDMTQRASAAEQLEQLARDLRTLEERRDVDAESRQPEMPKDATGQTSREEEPFSQKLRDQLTQQGLNDAAQDALTKPTNPEDAAKALKDAGLPPEPAERLARDIARENQQRQAASEAREQAKDLADAAEEAARQLREPPAQPESANQPSERRDGSRAEQPRAKPEDRQRPQTDASQPKQSGEGQEQQNQQQQSSASRQGQDRPSAKPADAPHDASKASREQSDEKPSRPPSGESTQQRDGESKSGEQQRTGESSSSSETASKQPDQQGKPRPGDQSRAGDQAPESSAPNAQQKPEGKPQPGDKQSQPQDAPKGTPQQSPQAGDQPSPESKQTSEGARSPENTNQSQVSSRAPDQSSQKQSGREKSERRNEAGEVAKGDEGKGKTESPSPAPSSDPNSKPDQQPRPGGGQRPESAPDHPNDGKAIERLAERLEKIAKQQDQTASDREQARDLRERAEKMLERMSPEQREQMRQWARDTQREQSPDGPPGASPRARSQPRSQGSGAGTEPSRANPADTRTLPAPRTELVDARPRSPTDRTEASRDQTVAQWLGSGTSGGQPSTGAPDAVVQDAVRSAERAIDDRTVPRRFDSLLERYFRRLPDAAKAGTRAGQPSTQPAAQPASDAP